MAHEHAAGNQQETERLTRVLELQGWLHELNEDYRSDKYEQAHYGMWVDHEEYRRARQEIETELQRLKREETQDTVAQPTP